MRILYYDFLRGLAIFMVVLIHSHIGSYTFESDLDILSVLFRQILNCAVPIFFAISGYFLAKKDLNSREEIFVFWKHQIIKVYVPVLVWSFPYLVLNIIKGANPLISCCRYLICGFSVYYFVAVIIQFYLLLPVLKKIRIRGILICLLLSLASVFILTVLQTKGFVMPLVVYAGHCDLWIIFFVLGIALRNFQLKFSIIFSVLLIIFSLILQLIESYWLHSINNGGMGIKISSFLFSIGMILFLFHPKVLAKYSSENIISLVFQKIGKYSFGIYLIHLFFVPLLKDFSLPWILRGCVVLAASVLTIVVFNKIVPKSLNRYLGF